MQQLFDLAQSLDVAVEYAPLVTRNGEYRDDLRRIRLRNDMSDRLARWTLAHELGHAHHGHRSGDFGQSRSRQEREANEWAAMHLIDLSTYREVEVSREGHVPSMARDIGIVADGILAYQRMLARLGSDVYLKPQLGTGRYRDKRTA